MAFPSISAKPRKREHVIAVDLGASSTKAVHIQRRGETHILHSYTVQPVPPAEPPPTREAIIEHLKTISQAVGARNRSAVIAMEVGESLVRQVEMPMVPVADMRMMIKLNPKNYLQQDLTDYVFDCCALPSHETQEPGKAPAKWKVVVGGARKSYLDELQATTKAAGFATEEIVPNLLGPPNAFEFAQPEAFQKEVVALVDLGFRHSTISILQHGELMLNRVVALGGDKLTSGLADMMSISYTEAEGIKVGMPQEVESTLQPLLAPIGRELRASIDFFEHQQDKPVTQVFLSGAAARSDFILQVLQMELIAPCKVWNPASFLELALPVEQRAEFEQVAPQLVIAVGAAMAAF